MFKQNFIRLCNQKGVAPTVVCTSVGLSDAVFSKWTDESIPRKATLQRIADYFGVTTDYLLRGHINALVSRIRTISKEKGISMSFLCSKMGVARVYFNDVEKQNRTIPHDKLEIIADILNVSVDYILGNGEQLTAPVLDLSPEEQLLLCQWRSNPTAQPFVRKLLDMPEPESQEDGVVS